MLKTAAALAAACACACPVQAQNNPEAATELTNTAARAARAARGDRRVDEVPATVSIFKPTPGARDLREPALRERGIEGVVRLRVWVDDFPVRFALESSSNG